jgi:hypothetical protein
MLANRVLDAILTVLAWVVVPVQIVTTLVLGILVNLSFGLLLLPISLLGLLLSLPMVGASWVCTRIQALREPIGILGLPWAVVAHTYVCLMPSMGELESRAAKLMLTESWPYSWDFWQFQAGRLDIDSMQADHLREVLARTSRSDTVKQRVIERLSLREQLDPHR